MSSFSRFYDLPEEIRINIWTYCLPHRFVELDYPDADYILPEPHLCSHFGYATSINRRPPLIAQVCREARQVALEAGAQFDDISQPERPEDAWFDSGTSIRWPWLDWTRDAVHMNWSGAYEPMYGSSGDSIAALAWDARYCTGVASLMIEFFECNYHDSDSVHVPAAPPELLRSLTSKPLSERLAKQLEDLLSLPKWLVVMDTVVVHLNRRAVAEKGLFGLMGDATVQIVDIADQERLDAYYDAAGMSDRLSSGSSIDGHKFETTAKIAEDLEYVLMSGYGCQELLKRMRPAVTFRLCTRCQAMTHVIGT